MLGYEGRDAATANYLRAAQFDGPAWTPGRVSLMAATWMKYREALEDVVASHPKVFGPWEKGRKDFDEVTNPQDELGRVTDCWGSKWENIERGLAGAPVTHPLADWSALDSYEPPDPMTDGHFGPRPSWDEVKRGMERSRAAGGLARCDGLPHGFMYMRLYYLRGFENFMLDLATGDVRLERLVGMVEGYNAAVLDGYLRLGAEYVSLGDDLGLQRSLPMSPSMWRRWIGPSYERLVGRCRDAGALVRLHTDGHVLEIIPDLAACGVGILNPQIRANGLEGLKETAKGRVCIDLDLDRQLFPFASPSEIGDHIAEAHGALWAPEGGLMLCAECEPDVPLENIEAICTALENVCGLPDRASRGRAEG